MSRKERTFHLLFLIVLFSLFYSQNNFVAIIDLPEGEHQYKFYVDGHWTLDPKEVGVSYSF